MRRRDGQTRRRMERGGVGVDVCVCLWEKECLCSGGGGGVSARGL